MAVPKHFCWTKFGVEAGESVEDIIRRKEQERVNNNGVFLWGIGNSLGPSVACLLEAEKQPQVIFSPIRSAPKKHDVQPAAVVAWASAETIDGSVYDLPMGSLVLSRMSSKAHYALVCSTELELCINEKSETFRSSQLRNLRTGRPVGYSQVTSIVIREDNSDVDTPLYSIAMRATLVYPYFVKLTKPMSVPKNVTRAIRNKPVSTLIEDLALYASR